MPLTTKKPPYTLAEICALLPASESTIFRWVKAGRFPRPLKFPGRRRMRFDRDEVDAFLKEGAKRG
jgi:excisionase family DNA binding protein